MNLTTSLRAELTKSGAETNYVYLIKFMTLALRGPTRLPGVRVVTFTSDEWAMVVTFTVITLLKYGSLI